MAGLDNSVDQGPDHSRYWKPGEAEGPVQNEDARGIERVPRAGDEPDNDTRVRCRAAAISKNYQQQSNATASCVVGSTAMPPVYVSAQHDILAYP